MKKMIALLLAAVLTVMCLPALAGGLIGSLTAPSTGIIGRLTTGASEGEIRPADFYNSLKGETDGETEASNDAEATAEPDAAVNDAQPTAEPDDGTFRMSNEVRALYDRLKDESPIQEGWEIQFAGESTLVMLASPDLIVWDIKPESGIMELKWHRDLYELMPEGSGNPLVEVSPDGSKAVISPSDGSVYLIDGEKAEPVADVGIAPGRIIWADDSKSFACVSGDDIFVYMLDDGSYVGRYFAMNGKVRMPVANELEWLNPAPTPKVLDDMLAGEDWVFAGMNAECVLFDSADGSYSSAYIIATGEVVTYPESIYSTMTIGRTGACPLYDASAEKYRLYVNGAYSDIPMLATINEGSMTNPYGWLGDCVCVLEQDFTARSVFKLHAANTATGITYTLLTPWEYDQMVNPPVDEAE